MPSVPTAQGLDRLQVPGSVRDDIEKFATQIAEFYAEDLASIIVFGSAVSGGFSEPTSDVNFLVIYSELNIADLNTVAKLAQSWAKKRRFAPRFLSRRNLLDSSRYFQIDMMEMRDAHVVLCGEDLLSTLQIHRADMRWQLAHEIKRMRMRLKQQFWRAAGDPVMMRRILLNRFSSLLHLSRALLFLRDKTVPTTPSEVGDAAVRELGIDAAFVTTMLGLKLGDRNFSDDELVDAFSGLMNMIRKIDECIDSTVA